MVHSHPVRVILILRVTHMSDRGLLWVDQICRLVASQNDHSLKPRSHFFNSELFVEHGHTVMCKHTIRSDCYFCFYLFICKLVKAWLWSGYSLAEFSPRFTFRPHASTALHNSSQLENGPQDNKKQSYHIVLHFPDTGLKTPSRERWEWVDRSLWCARDDFWLILDAVAMGPVFTLKKNFPLLLLLFYSK